jgi:HK97 family phage prohead protease
MSQQTDESTVLRPVDAENHMVEYDGKSMSLRTLVDAWDTARREHLVLDPRPFNDVKVSELRAGSSRGGYQIKGYAAVFDSLSHDLGGFKEEIQPGFFAPVLERNPDVHALWDHDTRYPLGRTGNGTLDLREDPKGLYNWIKVAPTSYAQDLRILLEGGEIDQASFAFTVDEDEFADDGEGNIRRTLIRARDLYDVTVTAQGAYPQTSSEVVARSIRSVLGLGRNVYAVGSGAADKATAATTPADGAASSPAVSKTEDDEDFARWHAAMETKMAARRASLAKLQERTEKLQ